MTPEENLKLLHRVFTALNEDDNETLRFALWTDGSIHPWVIVSDVFAWACADAQDITLENIDIFEQAAKDVIAACPYDGKRNALGDRMPAIDTMNCQKCSDIAILFVCRIRKQKPFKSKGTYPVHESVVPLIEAVETA